MKLVVCIMFRNCIKWFLKIKVEVVYRSNNFGD